MEQMVRRMHVLEFYGPVLLCCCCRVCEPKGTRHAMLSAAATAGREWQVGSPARNAEVPGRQQRRRRCCSWSVARRKW